MLLLRAEMWEYIVLGRVVNSRYYIVIIVVLADCCEHVPSSLLILNRNTNVVDFSVGEGFSKCSLYGF
jgi:hypothetical protein